ncbi:hypothetical protein JB92DRAFT_972202 [Gautieria morchelliformis]|nr:hypothetical protein JB92DRAFT_972202 [Gautieria morchelliformis]
MAYMQYYPQTMVCYINGQCPRALQLLRNLRRTAYHGVFFLIQGHWDVKIPREIRQAGAVRFSSQLSHPSALDEQEDVI